MCQLRTYTGRLVDVFHDSLTKEEIAHGLARVHRCGGQTPIAMTVAEHSFWVALKVLGKTNDPKKALAGLLHDASEALLCDIPRPLKAILPDYRRVEAIFQENIYEAHGIEEVPEEVKEADMDQWEEEYKVHFGSERYMGNFFTLPTRAAEKLWLTAYHKLSKGEGIRSLVPAYFRGK